MKITRQWMRDFTRIDVDAQRLATQLTMAGLEVESVEKAAPPFDHVVVGEVLTAQKHPNAEKLSLCSVTTDGTDRLQIICGASNVRAGLKVAVAKVGAHLPNGVVIEQAKLRGVESQGMLCSARELGLGTEHEGILELDASSPIGTDLREALDLDDDLLEVNVTPNRGDCMSVLGIARDYAAAQHREHLDYKAAPVAAMSDHRLSITLEAGDACPVFVGRVIRGVDPKAASPVWLRERLRRVGLNSISAIVDVTNYVMIELGQPMHAYDLAGIQGGIGARWARAGEKAKLLDGQIYELNESHLVIADANDIVGLAGIMGGGEKSIGADTTDVFLEAAHFSARAVAGKGRALGLLTDAGQRFERGVDPSLPEQAMERATALLLQIAGGEPGPVVVARSGAAKPTSQVSLRHARLERMLGGPVARDDAQGILKAIAPDAMATADGWRLTAPSYRFDIAIEEDLIEEIARLRGFDRIEEQPASYTQVAGLASETRVAGDRIAFALADLGYREAITYSFVDPGLQRSMFPGAKALALSNPISADLGEMRISLWPGLVQACGENLRRQQPRVRLFEIGRKYVLADSALIEIDTVAGLAAGSRWPEQWSVTRESVDFFDVKADLTKVLKLAGDVSELQWRAEKNDALHPGRSARIYRRTHPIGWIGELHPRLVKALDLTSGILIFELEIERAFDSKSIIFKGISKFPSVRRDISVVVDESVSFAEVLENVSVSSSGLLRDLRLFDIYRGAGIDSGRKSIALGLILQDSSRTLTDVDADAVVAAVVTRLREVLSAKIRDQ